MNAINSCFETPLTLAVLTLLGVCLLFRLHVPLLHGNLGNETENPLADCSHQFSLFSPSCIYKFPFILCSHFKCLLFEFVPRFTHLLLFFFSVGSVSKLAVHISRRASAEKYGQQFPRSAGFEGTECPFFFHPLPPRYSLYVVATQLGDLIHILTSKTSIESSLFIVDYWYPCLNWIKKKIITVSNQAFRYRLERFHLKGINKDVV